MMILRERQTRSPKAKGHTQVYFSCLLTVHHYVDLQLLSARGAQGEGEPVLHKVQVA
jgi:hypothetical protein